MNNNRMANAIIWLGMAFMFLVFVFVVWNNDKGSATEVALLNGTHVQGNASDSDCDALYHAIWKVKQEPSHSTLIDIAKGLDCPLSE